MPSCFQDGGCFEGLFRNRSKKNRDNSVVMDDFCYGIVGNIPSELRSADLRAFFSHFIESKGFLCFHFRHRPEVQRDSGANTSKINENGEKTCCCIIKVYRNKMDELIQSYNGQNWTNSTGKLFKNKVLISRIKISKQNEDQHTGAAYQTKQEKQQAKRTTDEFVESDLRNLLEMNPPHVMPNGNVGTPLSVFIELIRACKFPPHLIKKLGLSFPRSKKGKYGNVPFDYKIIEPYRIAVNENNDKESYPNREIPSEQDDGHTASAEILDISQSNENSSSNTKGNKETNSAVTESCTGSTKTSYDSVIHQNSIASKSENKTTSSSSLLRVNIGKKPSKPAVEQNQDSDDELEEWDRHASLHNDITSQERTKERLYEEDIELKWEKGGSGLVWYTDAAFWKQQEEADFDEETTDDWDVDMSIYEEEGAGDLDAKTLLQLRVEKEWSRGKNIDLNRVGGFEKYTRGFGGNIMKKHGWKAGQSLGSSQPGITEPLPNEGQHPSNKRGLGFYGEKLDRTVKRPRPTRELVISTIYDREGERNSELFQSDGPYSIKYRDKVDFVPQTGSS